jgi:hypothetical protein
MVFWGFEIGELLTAVLRYRHLRFRLFCIKIILTGIQNSIAERGMYSNPTPIMGKYVDKNPCFISI